MDIRKISDAMVYALVVSNNQRQIDAIGSSFHADITCGTAGVDYTSPAVNRLSISSANATDLPSVITLANELKADINLHFADAIAHNSAVSASVTTADAEDQTTADALLNALKAAYNTHRTASGVHFNNDSTNSVSSADATDLASSVTLANELKAKFNLHIASAPAGVYINLVSA